MSETHGMAQRGGNVISHSRSAPALQAHGAAGHADIFWVSMRTLFCHGFYLKNGGERSATPPTPLGDTIDAGRIARELGPPFPPISSCWFRRRLGSLFCTPNQIEAPEDIGGKKLDVSLRAFRDGLKAGRGKTSME